MTLEFLHTQLMKFNRLVSIDKLYKFSCFKTFLNETILPNLLVQYIKIPQNTTAFCIYLSDNSNKTNYKHREPF